MSPATSAVISVNIQTAPNNRITSGTAKPLRVKTVKVEPGDTVEQFAGRMALIDRQLDRFRVLNGLDSNDQLKPGEYTKIIVE